jgi:hypothetical protein
VDTALSLFVGVGLAAACGFRVFVPFFVMGLAAATGDLELAPGFEWIGTTPALVALAVATVFEILAFYVPWLDNLLDAIASPMAVVAGILAAGAVAMDLSPFLKWTLAVIAGGGAAGVVQGGSVLARASSTVSTGGLANSVVSTVELAGAAVASLVAIFMPLLAVLAVVATAVLVVPRLARRRHA